MGKKKKKGGSDRSDKTRAPRPARIEVKIDRALKRAWDEAMRTLRDATAEGAKSFDVQYETLGKILDSSPPLYLAGGYATERAFLAKERKNESARSVRRWARVAKFASPKEEKDYTPSKLDAAIEYLEALSRGKPLGRMPIDFGALRIPVKRDGKTRRIPLEDASVAQVRAAKRAVRPTLKRRSPEEKAVLTALQDAGIRGPSVRVSGGKLSLGDVPLEDLPKLARALSKVRFEPGVSR